MRQPAPPTYVMKSLPAPVGGINAVDALAAMAPTDAVALENIFPNTQGCDFRGGSQNMATGFPACVETVMAYNAPGNPRLFGISAGGICDATGGGAVGAPVVTGLSGSRWEYVNFGTPAGLFLYAFNGTDSPQLYNGSAWQAVTGVSSPIAVTGVTTSLLFGPCVWMNRLFAIESGSFRAWYLPLQSIGGAANFVELSSYFTLGGQLQAIFTISASSLSGTSDFIAFLTSMGEIALFQGTDPAFSGTFGKVGQYVIGHPIGRRCVFKYGADPVVLCQDGFVPVSATFLMQKQLLSERDDPTRNLSYKIRPLVQNDVQTYGANLGWQGTVFPAGNKLLINVPETTDGPAHQWVMNLATHAWTKFTGWNAACLEMQGNSLYFGTSGAIVQADLASIISDNGLPITAIMKPAFSYFDEQGQQKQFKQIRPIYKTNGSLSIALAVNVDFEDVKPTGPLLPVALTGSTWDMSAWDVSPWAVDGVQVKNWIGASGVGAAGTCYIVLKTSSAGIEMQALDYVYEVAQGGVL